MTPLALALSFTLAIGLTALAAYAVRLFVTTDLGRGSDWTSWMLWQTGRALIWVAVILLAGGLFGLAAGSVWRALNP
jgi:hypothetical protein